MAEIKENYDLTPRVAPNLDRHLVFPMLEFLQERQLYQDEGILKFKIELLNKTNMVDYAMDIYKSLYHTEDAPQGIFAIPSPLSVNLRFYTFWFAFLVINVEICGDRYGGEES